MSNYSKYSSWDLAQLIKLNSKNINMMYREANKENIDMLSAQTASIESEINICELVDEVKRRIGSIDPQKISEFIYQANEEQNVYWDEQWKMLYQEGAVFTSDYHFSSGAEFEVIRTYLPEQQWSGPNQIIFAREQGTGICVSLDDRDIPQIDILDKKPMYKEYSGLIKFNEQQEFRETTNKDVFGKWYEFAKMHSIFEHIGFEDVFERVQCYTKPNNKFYEKNQLILAKSQKDGNLYEFSEQDHPLMRSTKKPAIYLAKKNLSSSGPISNAYVSRDTLEIIGTERPQPFT